MKHTHEIEDLRGYSRESNALRTQCLLQLFELPWEPLVQFS